MTCAETHSLTPLMKDFLVTSLLQNKQDSGSDFEFHGRIFGPGVFGFASVGWKNVLPADRSRLVYDSVSLKRLDTKPSFVSLRIPVVVDTELSDFLLLRRTLNGGFFTLGLLDRRQLDWF